MSKRIVEVDLDLIDVADNVRGDVGDLTELVASIRERGLLQPPTVEPAGERYLLRYGQRRLEALRQIGLASHDVIVDDGAQDHAERVLDQLVENISRVPLNPWEESEAYASLRDEQGLAFRDISRRTGVSESKVRDYCSWQNLPAELATLLRCDFITRATATAVAAEFTDGRDGGAADQRTIAAWEAFSGSQADRNGGLSPIDSLLSTIPPNEKPSPLQLRALVSRARARAAATDALERVGAEPLFDVDTDRIRALADEDPPDDADRELLEAFRSVVRVEDLPEGTAVDEDSAAWAVIDDVLCRVVPLPAAPAAGTDDSPPSVPAGDPGSRSDRYRRIRLAERTERLLSPTDRGRLTQRAFLAALTAEEVSTALGAMGVAFHGDPHDAVDGRGVDLARLLVVHAIIAGGDDDEVETAMRIAEAEAAEPEVDAPGAGIETVELPDEPPAAEEPLDLMAALKSSIAPTMEPEPVEVKVFGGDPPPVDGEVEPELSASTVEEATEKALASAELVARLQRDRYVADLNGDAAETARLDALIASARSDQEWMEQRAAEIAALVETPF